MPQNTNRRRQGGNGQQRHRGDAGGGPPRRLFDRNPYNFAEYEVGGPWKEDDSPEWVAGSKHEAFHADRYSGRMMVRLKAVTPVFVPEGTMANPTDRSVERRFWRCWNGSSECLGIPGSSVKGVVSTLFEIWTNSAFRVVDLTTASKEIAYRRRSATPYVVNSRNVDGSITFRRAEAHWVRSEGQKFRKIREHGNPSPVDRPYPEAESFPKKMDGLLDLECTGGQLIPYRGNLFCVPPSDHEHRRYTHLAVRLNEPSDTVIAPSDVVQSYLKMLGEGGNGKPAVSFQDHVEKVKVIDSGGPGVNYYRNINNESFEGRRALLKRLELGDFVWGIERDGELVCFGKNVNFLWPSRFSPQELLGAFYRDESDLACEDASFSDLLFGFAGKHGHTSHPFRGRVRFGTFWKTRSHAEMPRVELGPLTSPSGVKLKARPLYLPPNEEGKCQTYGEAERMRGHKLYWHQLENGGASIPRSHLANQFPGMESQCPPPIRPLPKDTEFHGVIDFVNLTAVELGALLVSIQPQLFFRSTDAADNAKYGWKTGKGKSRGLGSVVASINELTLIHIERWKKLGNSNAEPSQTTDSAPNTPEEFVEQFKEWLPSDPWPDYVEDLKKLLKLPNANCVFEYHREPGEYGWMPNFGDPDGESNRGRPAPMDVARNIKP